MCRMIPGHRRGVNDMPDDFRATKKRLTGVGPAYLAWEASVLPMYYSRIMSIFYGEYNNFSITIYILMHVILDPYGSPQLVYNILLEQVQSSVVIYKHHTV